jgi:hypothetical protein
MIRVKIELEPYGMTINGKSLAEIRIWNSTGKGFTGSHNYEYEIYEPEPLVGKPIVKRGSIYKYDRQQPVIELLKTVLTDDTL